MKVSVVIPNYNYGRFLAEAIESVLRQTYACYEIIIVDDGSTDNSFDVAMKYEGKVKVIRQQNAGVGVARNIGAANSQGDIIAFLDADDRWREDKIQKQVASFENHREIGLVSCAMREFDASNNTIQFYTGSENGNNPTKILTFDNVSNCSGSAIAVRKDVFIRAGQFDKRKELHPSEDWEFFYRVALVSKID